MRISFLSIFLCLLVTFATTGLADSPVHAGAPFAADYPSIQEAIDANPGVPVEIRENIYNYFFSDDDPERERDRMDPEKRLSVGPGYPNRNRVPDHYLKEIGADRIFDSPDNDG